MTPGTLAALAEDNSFRHLRRLLDSQANTSRWHGQHLQLQARILCALYDIDGSAFEAAQIQQILKRREDNETHCIQQVEQADQALRASLLTLRQAQADLDAQVVASVEDQSQQPHVRQCQNELAQARQARTQAAGDLAQLREECTAKLVSYHRHRPYSYLRSHHFATTVYRRNVVNRLLDTWLAGQCNYRQNLQNEQLLQAMLLRSDEQMAAYDSQITALESRLEQLQQGIFTPSSRTPSMQRFNTQARQVLEESANLDRHRAQLSALEQCRDPDSQEALRWLKYQLKTDSLAQALHQWAAIGAQQAVRYQQELGELRQQLDHASQEVERCRHAFELAATLRSALRNALRDDHRCAADCDCQCHLKANSNGRCACQLQLPTDDRYLETQDYQALIDSYMNRTLPLNSLISTLLSQRVGLDGIRRQSANASHDRPLMQGHP
ncbi:TPA: hypothetical protein ACKP22_001276 [Pseudomonas putida]